MSKEYLEREIDFLRKKLYEAYRQSFDYERVVEISQELDDLLNQLEELKKHENKAQEQLSRSRASFRER
ncbi:aspartyl-phosphate phosphatase Spo0E family protein [Halobacillus litoralis]|uniref:aspartyl-phosphate phosphatase Spo0E family protein n=1 Tax=Halobacillus litoralis TaxID=45668 RepID=UPI001CD1B75B|nr:aspartyl-phosphate phosphatase Spo0E family protein [Halobacillus litoralis]MCA0970892.1 aspartyl-phosphate phosphatase Spo0E family protein [Halobacillus litoralis]